VVRTMGNQAGMPSDCRSGLVERPSVPHRLERDPITLVPDLADVEPSPGEGDADLGQTIREDPRRNDRPVTPELRREGRGEGDEDVTRLRPMPPPGRLDHDPPSDADHREVGLPGLRPVSLVDESRRDLTDRS